MINDPLFPLLVLIAGLLAALLAVAVVALRRMSPTAQVQKALDDAVTRFGREVEHAVDVHAVLKLTQDFKDQPELAAQLAAYSTQVVQAAIAKRINELGAQVDKASEQLTYFRKQLGDAQPGMTTYYSGYVTRLEGILERVQSQLTALERLAQQYNRQPA